MRFAIAAFGFAAAVSAHGGHYDDDEAPAPAPPAPYTPPTNATSVAPVYTTEVLTSYETYCPSATAIEHNGVTYTVTEATTLTITNCPCTVTKPVYSTSSTSAPVEVPTYPAPSTPVQPPTPHYPVNETVPAYTPPPTGTGAYTPPATTSPIAPGYTGAASKASFGIAGVLAAAGFIAAL